MEANTLPVIILWLVGTFGVGGLSVVFLNKLYQIKFFEAWTDGWKRLFAVALAIAVITILWAFGLFMGYFPLPAQDWRLWVEAWFAIVLPTSTVQQIIQGFTKPDQGQNAQKAS